MYQKLAHSLASCGDFYDVHPTLLRDVLRIRCLGSLLTFLLDTRLQQLLLRPLFLECSCNYDALNSQMEVAAIRWSLVRFRVAGFYVVRTSRRGRDNPGSTPGGDIWMLRGFELAMPKLLQGPAHGPLFSSKVLGSRRAEKPNL